MLKTLALRGFRGFESCCLTDLATVNLIVGKNNCGKTTVLEAVYLLAANGDPDAFCQIAARRDQLNLRKLSMTSGRVSFEVGVSPLLHGHECRPGSRFELSADSGDRELAAEVHALDDVGAAELQVVRRVAAQQRGLYTDTDPAFVLSITSGRATDGTLYPLARDGIVLDQDWQRPVRSPAPSSSAAARRELRRRPDCNRGRAADRAPLIMPQSEPSILRVEGKDDVHAIGHLLSRHGVECEAVRVDIRTHDGRDETTRGVGALLEGMLTLVKSSAGRSVGFVLDADEEPARRWEAVCHRLKKVGVTLPKAIPEGGFIGHSDRFDVRVGVWLMPDNRRSGALEEFLMDLVDSDDALLPIATKATRDAKRQGAGFLDSDRPKAELHTWLAWQSEPGLPYGSAVRAHHFRHDSAAALAFAEWFRRVFSIAPGDRFTVAHGGGGDGRSRAA